MTKPCQSPEDCLMLSCGVPVATLWMQLQAASRAILSPEMKQDLHVAFATCFITVARVALMLQHASLDTVAKLQT